MRRLSDQSVVCSVLTSPFSIGSVCLEPWPRWYQKQYQVPGTIHIGKPKENGTNRVESSRAEPLYAVETSDKSDINT